MILLLFLLSSASAVGNRLSNFELLNIKDIVQLACERNPSLSYCNNRPEIRRAAAKVPDDPFNERKEKVKVEVCPHSLPTLEKIPRKTKISMMRKRTSH